MTRDNAAILAERARKLAAPQAPEANSKVEPMLCFTLSDERFLVALGSVREVAAVGPITPIAGLPFEFVGLTTLRGDIIPVLDVRSLLGLPRRRPDQADAFLITASSGSPVGIWADQVEGVVGIDPAELTVDHPLSSPAFRGRTADLATVIDLVALQQSARRVTASHLSAEEA